MDTQPGPLASCARRTGARLTSAPSGMDFVKEPAEANERFLRDLVASPKAQPVNSHAGVGEKVSQLLCQK